MTTMFSTEEIMTAHERVSRRLKDIMEREHFFARTNFFSKVVMRFPQSVHSKMKWEGYLIGTALKNVYGAKI